MPPPKHNPSILLGLLVTVLCLSIGAIGLIVLFNTNRPSAEALAEACQSQVGAAISLEYGKVIDECKKAEDAQKAAVLTLPSTESYPGFSYPPTWTAVGRMHYDGTSQLQIVNVAPGFINYCQDCDGPLTPVTVVTSPLDTAAIAKAGSFDDYVKSLYASEVYTDVTFEKTTIKDHEVTIVKGKVDGLISGVFEDVIFKGLSSYVRASYVEDISVKDTSEIRTGWSIIKPSLDFSKIK